MVCNHSIVGPMVDNHRKSLLPIVAWPENRPEKVLSMFPNSSKIRYHLIVGKKLPKSKSTFSIFLLQGLPCEGPLWGTPPLGSSRHTPCCELQASEQWRRSGHRLCSWTCEAPQCWCTFQGVRNIQLKISFCPKYCFRKVWRRLDPWAWWMNLKTWRTALKHGGSP